MNNLPQIGIMTYYAARNYGAALQAFALQYTINKLGAETEFLRFFDKHNEAQESTSRSKLQVLLSNRTLLKELLFHPYRFFRVRKANHRNDTAFHDFRKKYLKRSVEPYYDEEDLKSANCKYNGFVTGSDMVWTPIGQNLSAYFLQFADKGKRFSYSPSMTGCFAYSADVSNQIKGFLNDMDILSCREQEGCDFVKELTGREAAHTLDPTILLSKEEWCKALNINIKKPSKPYILCYNFNGLPPKAKKEVYRVAKEHNWDVLYVPMQRYEVESNLQKGIFKGCGPKEFVELFFNASFCVSNGFHGFIFSLISENPFVVYHREKGNAWKSNETRISDFMDMLGISERYIETNERISDNFLEIDYNIINEQLRQEREKSLGYLLNIIQISAKNSLSTPIEITNVRDLSIKRCTGCGLCANICPFDAVKMTENKEGFIVPHIDKDKCKECGKCAKHCPSIRSIEKCYPKETFVCFSKDRLVEKSASGGVFITLAKYYIENLNGVVYGVILDENFTCKHVEAISLEELMPMQNSKYIQSEVGNCYPKVKKRLIEGRQVLFTGTPCQIAALKSYLSYDYDNLLTLEVVCHGVPNQKFWKKYIAEESKRKKITAFTFRTRSNRRIGRSTLEATVTYGVDNKQRPWASSAYYGAFIRNESFRMSCYYCQYACPERVADITMADCDSEKLYHDFYPKESKSICLLNTEKGRHTWDVIKNYFNYRILDYSSEIDANTCLGHPSEMPISRRVIYDDLLNSDWSNFTRKYTSKQSSIIKVIRLLNKFCRS